MSKLVIKIVQQILSLFKVRLIKSSDYNYLQEIFNKYSITGRDQLLRLLSKNTSIDYESLRDMSKAQIGQDIFVISVLKGKRRGFFVEFGATDGVSLSNTYMLEKSFGWDGILVEPGKNWKNDLVLNRTAKVDFRAVSSRSGEYFEFLESSTPEFSTIKGYENNGGHPRVIKEQYKVESVSLTDLLDNYNAPKIIDFISIDTEGTEFSILEPFNFNKYKFAIIVCEHNYSSNRQKVFDILSERGYRRIWSEFTQFDDWFILPELIDISF